jgi:hypothetical protein
MPSGKVIFGIIVAIIVVGLALGLGLGFGLKKDDNKDSGSKGTPDVAVTKTPKQTLLESGQAIQVAEVEISTAPPTFTPPTGIDTSKVSYTMTMDVNIAQAGPSWRNIMNNGTHDCCDATSRRPAVFITGTDASPPNRIHIVHGANEDNNRNIVTSFAATPNTYFNLTWVVDGGKLTTYINGAKDSAGTVNGTFNWGTPVQTTWNWNQYLKEYTTRTQNTAGSVKVKNVYWFNKPLSDADVTTLTTASTTSTYTPEPFSLF